MIPLSHSVKRFFFLSVRVSALCNRNIFSGKETLLKIFCVDYSDSVVHCKTLWIHRAVIFPW